jgi:hypothetical protein
VTDADKHSSLIRNSFYYDLKKDYSAGPYIDDFSQGILKGEYHCTIDLLFDWFGISCMTTDNFCFYLQNRLIQTSWTGGQWYSDTSPFSIPCFSLSLLSWPLKGLVRATWHTWSWLWCALVTQVKIFIRYVPICFTPWCRFNKDVVFVTDGEDK